MINNYKFTDSKYIYLSTNNNIQKAITIVTTTYKFFFTEKPR